MSLRVLLALIFCNLVWSAHPAMGKFVLLGFTAPQAAWLRYSSALVAYALMKTLLGRRIPSPAFVLPKNRRDGALLVLLGFAAFCFSPVLQMTGLAASQAMDNALIVALEPLMTVFFAWLLLGERIPRSILVAFGVALVGFSFLSHADSSITTSSLSPHSWGNIAMLLSLLGEVTYSLAGRKLVRAYPASSVFGSALAVGVLILTAFTASHGGVPTPSQWTAMPWQSALGVLWLGPLGTAVAYWVWMVALQQASVASLALTLFIQPLLGPLWGALFLGERLTLSQGWGCALILGAVLGQAYWEIRIRSKKI